MSDGYYININGRDKPELIDKTITGSHTAANGGDALGNVLAEHYSDITLTYWNGTAWVTATYDSSTETVSWSGDSTDFPTTLVNMKYQHKKGWQVIKEICERVGLDCYVHYNEDETRWELRIFTEVQIENVNALVSYGTNLISVSEYGKENDEIVNRAIVYGAKEGENVLLIKTEDDTTSQSDLWVKDKVFNQPELTTMDEVQDKADYEVNAGVNSVIPGGRVRVIYSHQYNPGDIIYISLPYCNMTGQYKIREIEVHFGYPFTANINFSKRKLTMGNLFLPFLDVDELVVPMDNLNAMTDSFNVYFDESPSKVTLSQCAIQDGIVRIESGQTVGSVVSTTYVSDSNVTECELRRYENFATEDDTYYVSNTGGNTWEEYQAWGDNETHEFDVADNRLKFKVIMNRASSTAMSPAYESIGMLYKRI
jgi:hypothetical protein